MCKKSKHEKSAFIQQVHLL